MKGRRHVRYRGDRRATRDKDIVTLEGIQWPVDDEVRWSGEMDEAQVDVIDGWR